MDAYTLPTALERMAQVPAPALAAQIAGKPLVILYPRHRNRAALFALVYHYHQQRVFTHALSPDDRALTDWLRHLASDPRLPHPLEALRAALSKRARPEDLAAALGTDLAALASPPYALLLDGLDILALESKAERFWRALPGCVPLNVQIVINARLLDLQPWNDLIRAGQAAIVGQDEVPGIGIYGEAPDFRQLEVYALGGGHTYRDGQPITEWDGTLPRNLFYYLVDHPMVTRDQIFAVFWPKMGIKEATNIFHVTKRKVSECLGVDLTTYAGGFYVPARNLSVHYDARLFEHAISIAIEQPDEAPVLWYQAVQLYRSDFLPQVRMAWAAERRAVLQQKYAQALINLGRYYRDQGDLDRALGFLLRALRIKADWEDVHQDVMRIYQQQGRTDDALQQYKRLEATLREMFRVEPGQESRRLYQSMAGRA